MTPAMTPAMTCITPVPAGGMNDQIARFEGVTTARSASLTQVTDPTLGHPLETGTLR
jgi:tripartite-type tricarboxylate transporter receptor subunit TctC